MIEDLSPVRGEYAIRITGPDQYIAQKMNWFWKIRRFLHVDRYIGPQDVWKIQATVTSIYSKPQPEQEKELKSLQEALVTVSRSTQGGIIPLTYLRRRIDAAVSLMKSHERPSHMAEEVAEKLIHHFASTESNVGIESLRGLVDGRQIKPRIDKGQVSRCVSLQFIEPAAHKLLEARREKPINQKKCNELLHDLARYVDHFVDVFGNNWMSTLELPLQSMGLLESVLSEVVVVREEKHASVCSELRSIAKEKNLKRLLDAVCEYPEDAVFALKRIDIPSAEKKELEAQVGGYLEQLISRIHRENGEVKWKDIRHFGEVQGMLKIIFPQIGYVAERQAIEVAKRAAGERMPIAGARAPSLLGVGQGALITKTPEESQELIAEKNWYIDRVEEWKDHCTTALRAIAEEKDISHAKALAKQFETECIAIQRLFPEGSKGDFSPRVQEVSKVLAEHINTAPSIELLREAAHTCERFVRLMRDAFPILGKEIEKELKTLQLEKSALMYLSRSVVEKISQKLPLDTPKKLQVIEKEVHQFEGILKLFKPSERSSIPDSLVRDFGQRITEVVLNSRKGGAGSPAQALISFLERATALFSDNLLTACFRAYGIGRLDFIAKNQSEDEQERLLKVFFDDVKGIWPCPGKKEFLDGVKQAIQAENSLANSSLQKLMSHIRIEAYFPEI